MQVAEHRGSLLLPDGTVCKNYASDYQLVPLCLILRQHPAHQETPAPKLAGTGPPPLQPNDTAVFLGLSNLGCTANVLPDPGAGVDKQGKRIEASGAPPSVLSPTQDLLPSPPPISAETFSKQKSKLRVWIQVCNTAMHDHSGRPC
jgi:hypothetical protein